MKNGVVSIVIPVYNAEKSIYKCIDSIVNQTYKQIEIIIIDDGSLDNTKEIINTFIDDRIIKEFIKNNGVSNARNIGIERSTGEYLMFVDADDYLSKNAVEILVNKMNETNVDVIRFNGYIENSDKSIKKIEFPVRNNTILDTNKEEHKIKLFELYNDSICSIRGYCWLLFMKNQSIKLFNKKLVYLEDKLFCVENMINNKKNLFINECLYYYCFNASSKTKDKSKFISNMRDIMDSKEYFMELAEKYNIQRSNLIDINYVILILYRLDYFISSCYYKEIKNVLQECIKMMNLKEIPNKKYKINWFKKVQIWLLKIKLYYIYYIITKVKNNIHK